VLTEVTVYSNQTCATSIGGRGQQHKLVDHVTTTGTIEKITAVSAQPNSDEHVDCQTAFSANSIGSFFQTPGKLLLNSDTTWLTFDKVLIVEI
jgi:hypothetical protein